MSASATSEDKPATMPARPRVDRTVSGNTMGAIYPVQTH
jgi:hypothetical protein